MTHKLKKIKKESQEICDSIKKDLDNATRYLDEAAKASKDARAMLQTMKNDRR